VYRRQYLAGLAGTASLLAGCAAGGESGAGGSTLTPAPVPDGSAPAADGRVAPETAGDTHVEALSGGSATVAAEYVAGREQRPLALARVLTTTDGGAFTHRVFIIGDTGSGAATRRFRGVWYENGEAVVRVVEDGVRSLRFGGDEFEPPSPADRFDRRRLVGVLAGFDPSVSSDGRGYELTARSVAAPARLPMPENTEASGDGGLRGRIGTDGAVTELSAVFGLPPSHAGSDPASVTYRLSVTDRGETVVERPEAAETIDWYRELRDGSPGPERTTEVQRPDG
jgi:hypothetical protein